MALSSNRITAVVLIALLAGLLTACATTTSNTHLEGGRPYVGRGSGRTPLEALSAAKVSAVYRAAVDILGEQTAAANRAKIERAISESDNPNAYLFNQTLEILQSGGSPISYEIRVEVNTRAVSDTLRALGIVPHTAEAEGSKSSKESGEVTAEVRSRIARDVDRMTYMVTFADRSSLDPFLVRSAVVSADAYLADNQIPYVDSAQVESLKKDQERLYEQETGKSVSITQWIAQRLHADVYIVLDGTISATYREGRHLATADVALRIFETSTGAGMGAANYTSSQPSVSLISSRDAAANAIQSAVYKAMAEAVRQARGYLSRDLSSGIAYDLFIIDTPDDRAMSSFMRSLALRVRDVRLVSWSEEETRFRVTLSGTASDLQDLVYETAQSVPGLSGMGLVSLRGRELTFDTGK